MAKRVREFTRAHAVSEPGYGPALTRLEELLTNADSIASRQHEGRVGARVARARREELRQMLHGQLVHYLVAVGVAAARGKSELAEQFKLPSTNATNTVFLTAVKALLAAGGEQRELLVQEGMVASLLEDLNRMVAEFESAIEAQSTARRDHIGARADLEGITAELVEQVNVLDGVTRYRFGKDPEVMAEWRAARRVLGLPQDAGTPPTAEPGDVKQAADVQQAA
jgi:hypothetical protein